MRWRLPLDRRRRRFAAGVVQPRGLPAPAEREPLVRAVALVFLILAVLLAMLLYSLLHPARTGDGSGTHGRQGAIPVSSPPAVQSAAPPGGHGFCES